MPTAQSVAPQGDSLLSRLASVPRRFQATPAELQGKLRSTIEMAVTDACGLLSRSRAVKTWDPGRIGPGWRVSRRQGVLHWPEGCTWHADLADPRQSLASGEQSACTDLAHQQLLLELLCRPMRRRWLVVLCRQVRERHCDWLEFRWA
jgi:hypothetical protein